MRLRQKLVYSPSCTESVFLLGDVMTQLDVSSRASCAMRDRVLPQMSRLRAVCDEAETLTVTADTAFYEQSLPDGSYLMIFEMRDSQGNSAYSQGVGFTVDGENITTSVYE